MKKFMFVSMLVFCLFVAACASNQQHGQQGQSQNQSQGDEKLYPNGTNSVQSPCMKEALDTENEMRCLGIAVGSAYRKDLLPNEARKHALDACGEKLEHAYTAARKRFEEAIGNNNGVDYLDRDREQRKHLYNEMMGLAADSCMAWDEYKDGKGNATFNIVISINKNKMAKAGSKVYRDNTSEADRNRVGFDEQEFEKEMREDLDKYAKEHPYN